jgi:hypothetical protein
VDASSIVVEGPSVKAKLINQVNSTIFDLEITSYGNTVRIVVNEAESGFDKRFRVS